MKPDARAEGRRWLAQAENDLAFAALASREGYFAQACFNSQQAAEKALKAFLYSRGAEQVFVNGARAGTGDAEAQKAELFEQIGRLKMELEWLKKKVAPFG